MAVAFKTALGTQVATASGTTLVITTTAAIAVGDLVVVRASSDNLSATTPTISCADSGSNTYTAHRFQGVNATAAAGIVGAILATKATSAINAGGTITVTFSGSVAAKAAYAESFTGAENTMAVAAVSGSGASTTLTTTMFSVPLGCLVCAAAFVESRTAFTGDTDTLGGAWSTLVLLPNATSGTATNCVEIGGQWKVPNTGPTTTQAFGFTITSTDWAAMLVAFTATPDPTITQAAYRFYDETGTESGSTALAAQDTATSGNLANGDGYGLVRVRLQSTTAVNVPATDDFTLQWEKNASGTWTDVFPTSGNYRADYYASNYGGGFQMLQVGQAHGQTFKGNGQRLTRVGFYLYKEGAPTGNVTAALYAHTGTFGSGRPTGAPLATSTTSIAASSISATVGWVYFDFPPGAVLTNGTPYVVTVGCSVAGGGANAVRFGVDVASGGHAGNLTTWNGTAWSVSTGEAFFEVMTDSAVIPYDAPSLTEGQATTNRLTGGTGTFTAGKVAEDGTADNVGWSGNNYTELLYSVKLLAAIFTRDDVIRFRVVRNGSTAGMTYSVTPTVNITAPYNERDRPVAIDATVSCTDTYTPGAGEAVLTQEGFRWRNDDGSETSATWMAAQDTNTTLAVGGAARLRTVIDTTADATITPTLYYKKSTDSTWLPVPVGPGSGGSSVPAVIAQESHALRDASTPKVTATTFTWQTGDLLVVLGGGESATQWADTPTAATGLTWAAISGMAVTANNYCSGRGYYAVASSAGSGTISVPRGGAAFAWGFEIWQLRGQGAIGNVLATQPAAATATQSLTTSANSLVLGAFYDWTPVAAGRTLTPTSAPVPTERADGSSGGSHSWEIGDWAGVSAGSANYGVTVATGAKYTFLLVEVLAGSTPSPPVYIKTSTNITAGGQATTAQLAAPSGKTTGDFSVGRMWDDENGTDPVTISAAWTPPADTLGWWKADASNTVSQWTDASGANRHFTQASSGNRPTRTVTLNSYTVYTFNGTDQSMTYTGGSNIVSDGTMSCSIVARFTGTKNNNMRLFSGRSSGGWDYQATGFFTGIASSSQLPASYRNAAVVGHNNNTTYTDVWFVYTTTWDGSVMRSYINGVEAVTSNVASTGNFDIDELFLCQESGMSPGVNGWRGDVAEIFWWGSANSGDRLSVEAMLASKFGL